MISSTSNIIVRLPGNRILVEKQAHNKADNISEREQQTLDNLKKRDKEVKEHEAVHTRDPRLNTIGGKRYHYVMGPDGKMYAVGGEVTISTSGTSDPKEALNQAQALKKASLAPGNPSPQDFAAASSASQMETEALNKLKNDNPYKQYMNNDKKNVLDVMR